MLKPRLQRNAIQINRNGECPESIHDRSPKDTIEAVVQVPCRARASPSRDKEIPPRGRRSSHQEEGSPAVGIVPGDQGLQPSAARDDGQASGGFDELRGGEAVEDTDGLR